MCVLRPLTLKFAPTMDRQAVFPSTEDTTLEDGDRFEVFPRFGRALARVTLPGTWGQQSDLIRQLEVDGQAVKCRWRLAEGHSTTIGLRMWGRGTLLRKHLQMAGRPDSEYVMAQRYAPPELFTSPAAFLLRN